MKKYVKQFNRFLAVTKADGTHLEGHANCGGCKADKNIILKIGQDVLEMLWDHVRKVEEYDGFQAA